MDISLYAQLLVALLNFIVRLSTGLQCYDCSDENNCDRLISEGLSGKCQAKNAVHGKCFIRLDPNKISYRGCADSKHWPQLDYDYNGCRYQHYQWWDNTPVLWCFCDGDLCNTNATHVTQVYSATRGVTMQQVYGNVAPVTPRVMAKEGGMDYGNSRKQRNQYPVYYGQPSSNSKQQQNSYYGAKFSSRTYPSPSTLLQTQKSAVSPKFVAYLPADTATGFGMPAARRGYDQGPPIPAADSWYYNAAAGPTPSKGRPDGRENTEQTLTSTTTTTIATTSTATTIATTTSTAPTTTMKDECHSGYNLCTQICVDTPDSYKCQCRDGYTLADDGYTCLVIDHCQTAYNLCTQICLNTADSYRCKCEDGYTLTGDGITCIALKSCAINNSGCQQICTAKGANVSCSCREGYELDTVDGTSCHAVDPCAINNGNCQQLCKINGTRVQCGCKTGYALDIDKISCNEINECAINNGGCQQNCTNTAGSYSCQCTGDLFLLQSDGKSCVATCPSTFIPKKDLGSCYKIFSDSSEARTYFGSESHCRQLHPLANLVSIESDQEQTYLAGALQQELVRLHNQGDVIGMLEGWQGWWTSGKFQNGINEFQWITGVYISNSSPYWGFIGPRLDNTCVWILQISYYNFTWGNYDCYTASGHVCEIRLPTNV